MFREGVLLSDTWSNCSHANFDKLGEVLKGWEDQKNSTEGPVFYQVTWSWRSWEVNAVITSEDYELLKSRPDVEVVMRDFRGYGNDQEFTFSDLSFTPIDAGMASNFAVMCCSVNEEVLTDLLAAVKSKIEIEGVS